MLYILYLYILIFTNYGLVDYLNIRKKIAESKILIHEAQNKKKYLLKCLKNFANCVDYDLLEMQARNIISVVEKGEEIYFWKENDGDSSCI